MKLKISIEISKEAVVQMLELASHSSALQLMFWAMSASVVVWLMS
ncbi:MAG TPA: hypothetical protein VFF26_05035 [Gallionella sp.]|nr:hypothetical protein [Gallionella sp.]